MGVRLSAALILGNLSFLESALGKGKKRVAVARGGKILG